MDHPEKWPFCGYNEIQHPPERYRIIDLDSLVSLMGFTELLDFQSAHRKWIQASLDTNDTSRQAHWTESIATGSKSFVKNVKKQLGFKAKGKSITGDRQQHQLRENVAEFGNSNLLTVDNLAERNNEGNNTFFWDSS